MIDKSVMDEKPCPYCGMWMDGRILDNHVFYSHPQEADKRLRRSIERKRNERDERRNDDGMD